MPPRKVGFFSLVASMSRTIHVSMATAAARLVLSTAAAASAPAKYGSPPLNPFQPSHRMPAPTETSSRLLGTPWDRSRLSRGPLTPADPPPPQPPHPPAPLAHPPPAAEVERAVRGPPAAAPEEERVNRVGERRPERHEDEPDLEADPADHAAEEQQRRDRGEHELEI